MLVHGSRRKTSRELGCNNTLRQESQMGCWRATSLEPWTPRTLIEDGIAALDDPDLMAALKAEFTL